MQGMEADGDLPRDQEEQMQLGIRILQSAFQQKMRSIESEVQGVRLSYEELRGNTNAQQKKNSQLEVDLVNCHQRSQQLAEENKELFKTVNTLQRQLARLEHLKATVMSSIQNDAAEEYEDHGARTSEEHLRSLTPLTYAASQPQPPARMAAAAPPVAYGGPPAHGAPSSTYGGALAQPVPGGAVASPRRGGAGPEAPPIDGKQFFQQARKELSYEAFNKFLASIKRMNNQQQSSDETLAEARRIFGPELDGLYRDFETLLKRQAM